MKRNVLFEAVLVAILAVLCLASNAMADVLWIPAGVKTIEEEAFYGDSSLDEVILPDGLEEIGPRAFANSSLRRITIASSLRYLAADAFADSNLSQVNAEWNTKGAEWAITHGIKLVSSSATPFSPVATIQSAGNTHAENGTDVTAYLGECFTVQDVVGGWFKFTAPVGGSYTFSVKAPSISQSFLIRVYANRSGSLTLIKDLRYDQSDEVVTYCLNNVIEGETIYWWDAKSSNTTKTFLDPFQVMVAPIETITTIRVQTATITGIVRDAITGQGIEGVTVTVVTGEEANGNERQFANRGVPRTSSLLEQTVYSTVTDQYGIYTLLAPIGLQLLHFELPGYISYDQAVTVAREGGSVSATILSRELEGGQCRVVLTWGNSPSDLDSHLISTDFHIYYIQKTTTASDAMLDIDDTDGEGPETITFTPETDHVYSYYVHDYTNKDQPSSSALSASGAKVLIYYGDDVIERRVPQGEGVYWHVFELFNGNIRYVDSIGNEEPTVSDTFDATVSASPESLTVGNSGASAFEYTISWTGNIDSLHVHIEGVNFIESWSKTHGGSASYSYHDPKSGIGDEELGAKEKKYTFYPESETAPGDYTVQIWAEDEMGRKSNTWTGTLVVYGGLQTTDARPGTAGYVDQVINETIQTETGRQVLENGLSVVFMFEGAGMSSNTSGRHYGLCVVVRNGDNGVPQIVFQCNDCTSIPDRPLDQTSNPPNGTTVPTLRDGIYGIEIGNHDNESKNTNPVTHDSRYACLTVKPVENNVVRFSSSNHAGTIGYSNQIQIHRRSINGIYESEPYSNSAGCNLIGAVQGSGTTRYSNKFNEFMYRVGVCDTLVEDQAIPSTSKRGDIGIYVVDRTLARDYLIELYGEEGANKIMRITK